MIKNWIQLCTVLLHIDRRKKVEVDASSMHRHEKSLCRCKKLKSWCVVVKSWCVVTKSWCVVAKSHGRHGSSTIESIDWSMIDRWLIVRSIDRWLIDRFDSIRSIDHRKKLWRKVVSSSCRHEKLLRHREK